MRTIVVAGILLTALASGAEARSGSFGGGSAVHVRAYTRSNGVAVRSYDRAAPRTFGAPRPVVMAVPVSPPTFVSARIDTPAPRITRTETLRPVAAPVEIAAPLPRANGRPDEPADLAPTFVPRPRRLAGPDRDPTSGPMVASTVAAASPVAVVDPHWCDDGDLRGGFCVVRDRESR